MRILFRFGIGALIVLIVVVAFAFYFPFNSGTSDALVISVEEGEGFKEIGTTLKEKGIIRSPTSFQIYTIISGAAHKLKPGMYSFEEENSLAHVVGKLVNGPEDFEVLIVEGRTLVEIDNELSEFALIKSGELVGFPLVELKKTYPFLQNKKSLEGFIFPDTYRIAPESSVETIVKTFLTTFQKKALPLLEENDADLYDALVLASLIEKEVPFPEDRALVSGVLLRRLAIGMGLQVDATIIYAVCEGRFLSCPGLTRADFSVESIFNTYKRRGLPPHPISNPGLDAIQAAVYPESSDFLYYLSDPETKRTIFSETLEEHNIQRSRYLQL